MLRYTLLFLLLGCLPLTTGAEELPSVFNGEDLAGWKAPKNNRWWSANDGVLEVRSGPKQTGSILFTEEEYGDFVMTLEFKMGEGTVDSGVMLRSDHDQIQIGESGSLKRDMTASPYIPGSGYPVEADGVAELLKSKDWNSMTIVAVASNYTVWLNGKFVMNYASQTATERGPIGLQLHPGRDMAIDFRNIRIASLGD